MINPDISRASLALLALAQNRVADLLQQAREDAEKIMGRAEEIGYQRGLEAGRATAAREIREAQEACRAEATAERQQHLAQVQDFLAGIEPEIIDLVTQVAEKIVKTQLNLDRTLVVEQVSSALLALGQTAVARIWVHPEDVACLEEARRAHHLVAVDRELSILADASIAPGGCVVEAGGSRVDARIDSQISRLRDALRQDAGLESDNSYADAA